MIGRMARAAELEVLALLRDLVAVDDKARLATVTRLPPDLFVLAAFAVFMEIGERPIRRWHAGIVFLDAAAHFRDQLFLQRASVP